jgi:hypothetical protein
MILMLDHAFSKRYSLSGKIANTIPLSALGRVQVSSSGHVSLQRAIGSPRSGYPTRAIEVWLAPSDTSSVRYDPRADIVVSIAISEGSEVVHHHPGKSEKRISCEYGVERSVETARL